MDKTRSSVESMRSLVTGTRNVISAKIHVDAGWSYAAVTRRRYNSSGTASTVSRPIVRWGTMGDRDHAELCGICLGLLAVRDGEGAVAYVSPSAWNLVSRATTGDVPRLPRGIDTADVRARLERLVLLPESQRTTSPSSLRLRAALGAPERVQLLAVAADRVRQTVTSHALPVSASGTPGWTADFSAGPRPVCAFVHTDSHGAPQGPTYVVVLPEPLPTHWGETAAVLLASAYARRTGAGPTAIYTDSTSAASMLENGKAPGLTPPRLISHLADDAASMPAIPVRWVRRGSTPAQITVDRAASHAIYPDASWLPEMREVLLEALLPTARL